MTHWTALLYVFASIGLLLYGLRLLLVSPHEGMLHRIADTFEAWRTRNRLLFGIGLGSTVALQASSITVILTMGLLQRGALTLEQGLFAVLGASVGTTLKAWILVLPFSILGPGLVGATSILLVFYRAYTPRKILEVLFAIGIMFLAWHLAALGLVPLLEGIRDSGHLNAIHVHTLPGLMFTIAVGALATSLIHSSSTVVFLTAGLAATQVFDFPTAAALVLGANVGTTATPVLASLEYRRDVRRLALANTLIQVVGVALFGMLFHSFLSMVGFLADTLVVESTQARLALVHTTFNAINAMIWYPLIPVVARMFATEPPKRTALGTTLTATVRAMLANVPEDAAEEAHEEYDRLLRDLRIMFSETLEVIGQSDARIDRLTADLRQIQDRVQATLSLVASAAAKEMEPDPELHELLTDIHHLRDLTDALLGLVTSLRVAPSALERFYRDRLDPVHRQFIPAFDQLWARALDDRRRTESPETSPVTFADLSAAAHRTLYQPPHADRTAIVAVEQVLVHLHRIWRHLFALGLPRPSELDA